MGINFSFYLVFVDFPEIVINVIIISNFKNLNIVNILTIYHLIK